MHVVFVLGSNFIVLMVSLQCFQELLIINVYFSKVFIDLMIIILVPSICLIIHL